MYCGRIKWPQLEDSLIVLGTKQTRNRRHSLPRGICRQRRHTESCRGQEILIYWHALYINQRSCANKTVSHYPGSHLGPNPTPGGVSGNVDLSTAQTKTFISPSSRMSVHTTPKYARSLVSSHHQLNKDTATRQRRDREICSRCSWSC